MGKYMLFLLLTCLAARGQTITDADLSEILPVPVEAQSLQYWFDTNTDGMQTVDGLSETYVLDVSLLSNGLHTIHYRAVGSDGLTYGMASTVFLKVAGGMGEPATAAVVPASNLQYWFDNNTGDVQTVDGLSGTYVLDVSLLSNGLHTIHYRAVGSDGLTYGMASAVFLKVAGGISENISVDTVVAKKLKYWYDTDVSAAVLTDVASGIQSIDVSALPSGLHALHYQLVYEDGSVGPAVTGIFLKNDIDDSHGSPNVITRYQYRINDNAFIQTIELKDAANPCQLVSLLPVSKEPIRSKSFHFAMTNDVPTIYAKNDLHIRFHDAQGYFTDGEKPYIDYSVKQEVEPVGELQATQTFERVAVNTVRWYTLSLEAGDSVAFNSSQAATIQLFSPSGKELHSVTEAASVSYSGVHTWEDGTHYLAVHDVTGTRQTMTLSYMHIDKYAILEQDVPRVGNGGYSTITYKGNGFRDLYAVELYNAQGDTIRSVDIGHESDVTTSVTFDFTGAEPGRYDVLFRFATDDILFGNITVEEAEDIELVTTVTFPSAFPHGKSTTYTVQITNKGNMTAYAVPVYTYVMNKWKEDGIYHIKYEGLGLRSLYELMNKDSLSVEDHESLLEFSEEKGDEHYFMYFKIPNENSPGDSIYVRSNYFFVNIAPNSTKSLTLTISANESVWAHFTVPEDWSAYSPAIDTTSNANMAKAARSLQKYCCIKDRVECILTLASDATSLLSTITSVIDMCIPASALQAKGYAKVTDVAMGILDCGTSHLNASVRLMDESLCRSRYKGASGFYGLIGQSTVNSILSTMWTCFTTFFPMASDKKYLKHDYRTAYKNLYNGIKLGMSNISLSMLDPNLKCLSSFTESSPSCPKTTSKGGSSAGGMSFDPNDIYGYLSESGSKFITDSVTQMNYTIEFENDTTFATAAAYRVVVRDTLDSRYIDLASYAPVSVRIGDRLASLDGAQNFNKTIDMRPEINSVVQIDGGYDVGKGILTWTFTSLDPMTMEPATDIQQGFLPVNYDGSGIGEVSYVVAKKTGLPNGTEISNRASITFDVNEPILTPTWTNIVDATPPVSTIDYVLEKNDSTVEVALAAVDELSGVWRYDVYIQQGTGSAWWKAAENVPADSVARVRAYNTINNGYCVVATDSAGNREVKTLHNEMSAVVMGDTNGDGAIDFGDVVMLLNHIAGREPEGMVVPAADLNDDGAIDFGDVVALLNLIARAK